MLTSSGQAASFYSVFNICGAGDHFVSFLLPFYGGTFNLFSVTMKKLGIDVTFVNPDADEKKYQQLFARTPKPYLQKQLQILLYTILDIEKFACIAHKHNVPLIIDNTLLHQSIADHLNGELTSSFTNY